jgi:hypothetical protein
MDDRTFKWCIILAVLVILGIALYALYIVAFVPCDCITYTEPGGVIDLGKK